MRFPACRGSVLCLTISCLAPVRALPSQVAAQPDAAMRPVSLVASVGGLQVQAYWDAIAASTYRVHEKHPELFANRPAMKRKEYGAEAFQDLLSDEVVRVGETWKLPGFAYARFLKQFCKGVRTKNRGMGMRVPGGYACLRACSAEYADVEVRVHADFVLAGGRGIMAPAQFRGSLLIDRRARRAVAFRLGVPPRDSNADILASLGKGTGRMSADIVYIPRMELVGGKRPPGLKFTAEISVADARARLAREFYRFVDIDWRPFGELVAAARRTGKPIHLMVLFGTLDDESC